MLCTASRLVQKGGLCGVLLGFARGIRNLIEKRHTCPENDDFDINSRAGQAKTCPAMTLVLGMIFAETQRIGGASVSFERQRGADIVAIHVFSGRRQRRLWIEDRSCGSLRAYIHTIGAGRADT